ncbi:MAG TPA: barstar family protein [Sphingomonas sp.]|uniref:barstar family protein n=1 Tax=Sphingomonas sp. TaxID=28214 RepID=UPI002C6CD145|nr:barstar family protein [Sphingomonas sp.]HMI18340.1 barstar family protein [Sphingomonas sp.]
MQTVELDAATWTSALDFYDALLAALIAPKWHGKNVNALVDSMIYGRINVIEPPLRVNFTGLEKAGYKARDAFEQAAEVLASEGAHCHLNADGSASIEIVWPLSTGSFKKER